MLLLTDFNWSFNSIDTHISSQHLPFHYSSSSAYELQWPLHSSSNIYCTVWWYVVFFSVFSSVVCVRVCECLWVCICVLNVCASVCLCVCELVCVCVNVCICVCECLCECVCAARVCKCVLTENKDDLRSLPLSLPSYILRQFFSLTQGLAAWVNWLARSSRDLPVSALSPASYPKC